MPKVRHKLPVEEFTTPNPVTADENATMEQLIALMQEHGVRHIPITKGSKVTGIVSDRDVRVIQGLSFEEKSMIRASDIMKKEPFTVSADTPMDNVAYEMSEKKIGSAIVLDENDELYGIFTATDALNALIEIIRGVSD